MFNLQSNMNIHLIGYGLGVFLLLGACAKADYAPRIQNPNAGYLIKIDTNSLVEPTPVKGTDGKNYYRVGNPILVDGSSSTVSVTGAVQCIGRKWGSSSTQIHSSNAYHRLFMYTMNAGFNIEGKIAYQINSNLMMTVESRIMDWKNIDSGMCSYANPSLVRDASSFTSQFPITITFYINERIIDGKLLVPAMNLGGYVRAFTSPNATPPYDSWPINEVTVPMRLAFSELNIGSLCTTMTRSGQAGTLNLRHGQLNSTNFDSTVTEKITYTCKFASSTKVRLRLDYTKDDDSQKRLPLTNGNNDKIHSQLIITDEQTGQSGTDFKLDIHQSRTVNISSRIQGIDAVAGHYQGSAWLIATYD